MIVLRLVLLGLAAVITLSLGGHALWQASRNGEAALPTIVAAPDSKRSSADAKMAALRSQVEARLQEAPDYARFFDRLKRDLPSEYESLVKDFAKREQSGPILANIDSLMSEAVRSLRLSRGAAAAKADGPALVHIFDMQLQVLKALSLKEPRLCVDFLYGGASEGFFAFSAEHRSLVADLAIAGLNAIEDGQVKRIDRAPPSDTDFDLLEQALKKRDLTEPEVQALLDGKVADPPIPDRRMCDIGLIYLETLAGLPDPVKLRIYGLAVELMARS